MKQRKINIILFKQSDSNTEISKEVEYTDLLGKIFTAEMLDADLNVWANKIEFHLIYCEGKQNLKKKSFKRTLKCNVKNVHIES